MTSLDGLALSIGMWGRETFPRGSFAGTVEHLRREVDELSKCETQLDRAEELADLFILTVQAARLAKVDLAHAVSAKHEVNQRRTWGEPDADGVIEHDRGSERINGAQGTPAAKAMRADDD